MDEKVRLMKMRLLEKLMADLEDYDAETIPKRRGLPELEALPALEEPEEDLEMAMNPEETEEAIVVPEKEKETEEDEEEMLPGFLRRVKKEREAKGDRR